MSKTLIKVLALSSVPALGWRGLQGATSGAFAGDPETRELMEVGLDQDPCCLVALGWCPALQTDHSSYTKLLVLHFS